MAIAEDVPATLLTEGSTYARADLENQVRVAVHDASRVEWSLSLPLPEAEALDYLLSVEIRIPQNAFVRHSPWDQMQSFTRLDGPAIAVSPCPYLAQIDGPAPGDAPRGPAMPCAARWGRATSW